MRRRSVKNVSRRKGKIAVAPLIGLIVGLYPGFAFAMEQSKNPGTGATPATGFLNGLMYAYMGITDDGSGGKVFDAKGLWIGTAPLVGGAIGGFLLHKVANKLGVNRSIPWVSI